VGLIAPGITAIAKGWFEAWNDRDFDRGSGLVADGAEIIEVPTNETFRGPSGSREESEKWANGLPDGRVTVKNDITSANAAVLESTVRGTHTGPFVTPAGEVPATGRTVELDFCTILEIEGGEIQRIRHYYDTATLMRQLGLLPEVGAGATT
jgi:steroid delta-isomerase-like uncharacterized protein